MISNDKFWLLKTGVLLLFLVSFSVCIADQLSIEESKPSMAPLNPDFIDFQNFGSNLGIDYKTGFIPPETRLSDPSTEDGKAMTTETFPSRYDLRDYGRVTSIKNQNPWGTCWAHAAMASLESNLTPGENLDFSEKNLVNRNLKGSTPDSGGNYYHSGGYLTAQLGPISEQNDPYPVGTWNYTSPSGPVEKNIYEIHWLPDKSSSSDLSTIKNSIINFGALSTTYYEGNVWNYTYNSSYYSSNQTINHAVTIVGWDDNFSRNNFTSPPPGDGAFLIKNSWGSNWCDKGYGWISYYDANFGKYNTMFFASNTSQFDEIYQHDLAGPTTVIGSGLSLWGASCYTVNNTGYLKAIGFYTSDNPTSYLVKVMKNPTSGPDGGEKIFERSGSYDIAGYHLLNLTTPQQLAKNDVFSIIIYFTNTDYSYPLAVQYPGYITTYNPVIYNGDSYYSSNGITWNDMKNWNSDNSTVSIKAYFGYSPGSAPVANFTSNLTSGQIPLNIQFTDLSTGSPTSWSWTFGDGGSSDIQNPNHTYSSAGLYTVNLTVSNVAGSDTRTAENYINATNPVITPPVADFTSNVTSGSVPLIVQFTDNSTGSPSEYLWKFGDGNTSTEMNPVYLYSIPGQYSVNLTVNNEWGTSSMNKTNYITATEPVTPPIANFTANLTTGAAPLCARFTDLSTGNPTSWLWNFGDLSTTTEQHPTHIYQYGGNYSVNLTVTNSMGSNSRNVTDYMQVSGPGPVPPVASFTSNVTTGIIPLSVQFTDTSSGSPKVWNWTFGDGGTSYQQNPVHIYETAGMYGVSLNASNSLGSNVTSVPGYITALNGAFPVAYFNSNLTSGQVPLSVQFYDQSLGNVTSWNWTFGDGGTSSLQSPVHQYVTVGMYGVSLNVSNSFGSNLTYIPNYINATGSGEWYNVTASAGTGGMISPSGVIPVQKGSNQTFIITPSADYEISDILVDGNSSGIHTTYTFTNIISDHSIHANFRQIPIKTHTINATSNEWSIIYPKGSKSYPVNSNQSFIAQSKPGADLTDMIVDNSSVGAVENWIFTNLTDDHSIHAIGNPTPGQIHVLFNASPRIGVAPLNVSFSSVDTLGSPNSWYWQFGDGKTSNLQNPYHNYVYPGVYSVSLRATNDQSGGMGFWNNIITVS